MKITLGDVKKAIREAYDEAHLPHHTQVLRDNLREQGIDVHPVDQPYWTDDVINALRSSDSTTRQLAAKVWAGMNDGYTMMLKSKFTENHKLLTAHVIVDLMQRVLDSIDTSQMEDVDLVDVDEEDEDPDFPSDLPSTLDIIERSRDLLHLCRQHIEGNISQSEVKAEADDLSADVMNLDTYAMLTDEADTASGTVYHTVDLFDPSEHWKDSLQAAVRFLSDTISASEMAAALKLRIAEKFGI